MRHEVENTSGLIERVSGLLRRKKISKRIAWIDEWIAESEARGNHDEKPILKEMTVSCGGYFGGHVAFVIRPKLRGYVLSCEHSIRVDSEYRRIIDGLIISIRTQEMNSFLACIFGKLRIHKWKRHYWKHICDGVGWSVEMVFADETHETLEFIGSNAWPSGWDEFLEEFACFVQRNAKHDDLLEVDSAELKRFILHWFRKE